MESTIKQKSIKTDDVKKVESYRWIVWSILAAVYVFVTFHRMSAGVVKNDLESTFNIGAAQFANIGAMYFYAYFIMQIPSGILADKIGPKKTVSIFSIIAAAGSVMFGMAPNLLVAYAGRFLVGIGVSVVFICLIKIQSRWFYSRNFALMIGFVGMSANLGALLAQTPLVVAVGTFGWRSTFIYMGLAMIVFAVLTVLFVKDDPKDMGLPGMDELENRPAVSSDIKVMPALKSIMSNKRTWIISLSYIGLYTGYVVLLGTFGVSYLMQAYTLEKIQAANYIMTAVVGSAISGLVIGYLSDRFKTRKIPLLATGGLTLLGWIVLIYTRMPIGMLAPFMLAFGFVMSGFTMCWTVGTEVNDRRLAGMATGVVNCIGFLGAAVVPVIMGKILDNYQATPAVGYEKAYFVLIALMAVSFTASLFTTETKGQNIYEG
ncbi:major facilitator superfamily MFS_1 [Peptoclostridium acidaminophilum DSM 3953]|uniref:Major facilitator superfamily MFS_1 n=1 Tax=Peptoclostridium acidaminophilum DSM 3953 TaxID=1286171 RepID=W8TGP1_PEPAC|nr:MFS transporter [Peptoclostridium acidaminophilum]AHM57003.1 major facilitator superfamily MFS_1 [Peptoclostridium acidaminophilum DSM 3953]